MFQPLDGGILETLKRKDQKLLLQCVLAETEGDSSLFLLETIKYVSINDLAYMTGEAWEQVKAESISKIWRKTLLNRIDQVSGAETSSERVSCEEPEGEPDTALLSAELTHADLSSVNEADVQESLNIDRNEPGYSVLTEEEIIQTVSRLDEEDKEEEDELIGDEPVVPSHSESYASLTTCIQWLERQAD